MTLIYKFELNLSLLAGILNKKWFSQIHISCYAKVPVISLITKCVVLCDSLLCDHLMRYILMSPATSYECQRIPNWRQLDCLFNSLFKPNNRENITHYWPFSMNSHLTSGFHAQMASNVEVFPWYDVIKAHSNYLRHKPSHTVIRPVSQSPQYTRQISHNAPLCHRNVQIFAHFCHKCCIVRRGTSALWDLWDWAIGSRQLWNPLSQAIIGKFHGSGWHSKQNCL